MTRCGPFELDIPLGKGGMATVWRASLGSASVAIKFVDLPSEGARQQFAQEVRAVAALDHPGIVQVLDHGVLDGTPWMALELASGGDLNSQSATLRWEHTRVVLLALLDALAHAHARGVIHRDLKAGNVLLSTLDDPRPGVKLADFGIAHLLHDTHQADERKVTGTPSILAPEQWRGSVPEYGPWTDLYALGCLATRLVTGSYPFRGRSTAALLRAHLEHPPPPLTPRFPTPTGLAPWIARLLAKAPGDRFRSAADAADALAALEVLPCGRIGGALGVTRTRVLAQPRSSDLARRDWRVPARPPFPRRYVQAGLATLPLRAPRTVEREAEADTVFEVLDAVRRTGRPHAVLVTGEPGVGRSHLGRWLARQAAERGLAWSFEASVAPDEPDGAALLRLLGRITRTDGVAVEGLRSVVERALSVWGTPPPQLCDVLVRVLDGTMSAPSARRGALRALLAHRAVERPVWLWVDDGADDDVLQFVELLLAASFPALVVVDVGDAPPVELATHPRVQTVALAPLSEAGMEQLVASTLPLAPALARRLVELADGLPAVAMHHLHTLASSGRLQAALGGFVVDGPWEPSAVRSAPQAATQRVRTLLDGLDERQTRALVIAAALGTEVERDLWTRAVVGPTAERASWLVPLGDARACLVLEDRMMRAGDAIPTPRGWRFVGAVREVVLEHARDDVLRDARRSAARALQTRGPPGDPVRVARLQHAAGDLAPAFEGLERAVLASHGALRGAVAVSACTEALQIADALGLSPDDPRRAPFHARQLLSHVDNPGSRERARELLALGRLHGWPLLRATAHAALAALSVSHADPAAVTDHLREARTLVDGLEVSPAWADVQNVIAWALYRSGQLDEARVVVDQVMAEAGPRGWLGILSYAQMIDSGVRRLGGDPLPVEAVAARAEALFAQGSLLNAGSVWVDAAEQHRAAGDLEASDALNARAAEALVLVGSSPIAPTINQAINAFLRQDAASLRRMLDRVIASEPPPEWTVPIAALELAWASLLDDVEVSHQRFALLERALAAPGLALVEDDHAQLAGAAEHLAARAPDLAARILALLPH